MTDDRDDPLLLAVEGLTKPQRSKVIQGEVVRIIELPPLLSRLEASITSSMGGNTGGASLKNEGSVLDVDALFKMIRIVSQIKDWCHILKLVPTGDAAHDLTAWFLAIPAQTRTFEYDRFHARQLSAWANEIQSKLDPWREKDLPDACPACGANDWFKKEDGLRYLRPLIIRYKPDVGDLVGEAKGLCRACAMTWNARELAREIELRDNAG